MSVFSSVITLNSLLAEPFDSEVLRTYGERLLCKVQQGRRKLAAHDWVEPQPVKFNFDSLYGPFSPSHAFYHKTLTPGIKLTEPQVTSSMKHFLDHEVEGEAGLARIKSFLEALLLESGISSGKLFDSLKTIQSYSVKAEESFSHQSSRRSIDLLFRWNSTDLNGVSEEFVVALENKLEHSITTGQLAAYRTHALSSVDGNKKQVVLNNDQVALIVLAKQFAGKNDKQLNRNKEWRKVTWIGLLRSWEKVLSQTNAHGCATDFARFRRALWLRCADI